MKKIFLFMLSIPLGATLFAANPTYTIGYKKGGNTVSAVKLGDYVIVTAKFSEKMNNAFVPKIALVSQSGNANGVSPFNMTLVDSVTYTYNWTVGSGDGTLLPNVTIAKNIAGELVTNTGSFQTIIKIDNTIPELSSSTIGIDVRYYGALKVTDSLVFNFSEGLKTIVDTLPTDIHLRLGGKQGANVAFTAHWSNNNKHISVKPSASLQCFNGANMYYIGFPDSTFADSVGNILALTEIVFHPDSVDVQPILSGVSSGTNHTMFCPEDVLTCTNPNNNLQYQWLLDGNTITGETAHLYTLPIGIIGNYALRVTNPITTCVNTSEVEPVTIYPTAYPTVIEKSEKGIIDLLVVDNSSDLYTAYKWTKSTGADVNAGIINNRQFLTLSNASMNGLYKVMATDIYGCKLTSATKNIAVKKSLSAFPSVNDGSFQVVVDNENEGDMIIRVVSQQGVEVYNAIYSKQTGIATLDINTQNANAGIYFVEVIMNNAKEAQQIIIQK